MFVTRTDSTHARSVQKDSLKRRVFLYYNHLMTEQELLGPYKLTLGFEIHLQPKTKLKMFCGCSAEIWGDEPNTHTCPTCLGLPGALPVPNFEAVKKTQLLGLALNCTLNQNSRFDRKHYFYPDLPKGYQISQYKQPLCENGRLDLESGHVAQIERIHLEEDTAKSFHEGQRTLIDFNKSGLPLIELVTTPCFNNLADAVDYCKQVQNIARFIDISECDMEKGQMRLEANISLRTAEMEKNNELAKYKVEVKNINSFRFMEKAVLAEIKRQREILETGQTPAQENRGYNEAKNTTVPQRDKEEAHDYRYFPEPDIPPMQFEKSYFDELKKELPETPAMLKSRLVNKYKITEVSARMLVDTFGKSSVAQFEKLVGEGAEAQQVANAIINKKDLSAMNRVVDEIDSTELLTIVKTVISQNEKAVTDYRAGKEASLQFLIGQVMRNSKGKAKADDVRDAVLKQLGK